MRTPAIAARAAAGDMDPKVLIGLAVLMLFAVALYSTFPHWSWERTRR